MPPQTSGNVRSPVCPYLGRSQDPATHFIQPHNAHRCHTTDPAGGIELGRQAESCYGEFAACPRFLPLVDGRRAEPVRVEPLEAGAEAGESVGGELVNGAAERARQAEDTARDWVDGLADRARRFSFEEWTVYGVTGVLLVIIAYFAFLAKPLAGESAMPTLEPGIRRRALELMSTATTTPTHIPTATPRPTRPPDLGPAATVPVPTPPEGGLVAALSPSERGVGSFNEKDRLPAYGSRSLHAGRFNDQEYLGGILFPLNRIPETSRVSYVALELTGLSDENLNAPGKWTVELLDPEAADEWSNLSYETLRTASTRQMQTAWQVDSKDMAPRKVNVLEFSDDARDLFMQRLDQGKVAFRIRGPGGGENTLFTWDTGYGEGFGTRPVLRVVFVPPEPTPGPRPGEPTPVPFIVWISEPTPAPETPTPTPVPMSMYALVRGMILFLSDRFGDTRLMVYDPATERVGQVTQSWPYVLAQDLELRASGVTVSVAGRPCGSGAKAVTAPDGTVLEKADPARRCTQLMVTDPEAPQPHEITAPGWLHYEPAVSPDGQWIAYVSTITGNDEIFKIRRDGRDNTRLTENVWEWDKHPSWSPDGGEIVFWSNREGRKQIYVVGGDGKNVRNVSSNMFNDWDPIWVK